jgi:hypothetical protein
LPDAVPQFIHLTEACVADSTCSGGPQVRADRLALAGLGWDSISVAGLGQEERALLLARGYRQLAPGLLQARPSRIRITADVPADLAEFPVVVRYGYPTTGVIGGETMTGTRGRVELELGPVVAGPTVLEVFFDRDGDGVPSAADVAVFESPRLSVLVPPGDVLELGR